MAPPLRDLILHPDTFFGELNAGPDEYKIPIIIVGICMILDGIRQFILMDFISQVILKAMPASPDLPAAATGMLTGFINIILVVSVVESMPAFFAYWLIIAAVFFIISSMYSTAGTVYKVFIATGWGMLPFVVFNAVSVVLIGFYRNIIEVTISPEYYNLTSASRHSSRYSSVYSDSPDFSQYVTFNQPYFEYSQISFALFAAGFLCCCLFWIYAMKHTRSLSMKQSAITVVLPVILYLACLLGSKIMNGWI